MNTKRKALKGLLILICVLLACMFFARTVQTITTAKVQKITATRGKLEDIIKVDGEIRFSKSEPVTLKGAKDLPLTIEKVLARPGYQIKAGDTLFTASVPDFEDKLEAIKADYDKKVRERAETVAGSLRIKQTSEQNDYYNAMIHATDDYWDKLFKAKSAALAAGVELPDDISQWQVNRVETVVSDAADANAQKDQPQPEAAQTPEGKQTEEAAPVETVEKQEEKATGEKTADKADTAERDKAGQEAVPDKTPEQKTEEAMKLAMQQAYEAMLKKDEATDLLKRIYTKKNAPAPRIFDGVFDYIKKIDKMSEEIHDYLDKMLKLEKQKIALERIKAERDGWLTDFSLKAGDKYDGSKPAYSLSLPGEMPVIRCDISDVKKTITKGMKARLSGNDTELKISDVVIMAGGKKYAVIELDEDALSSLGGLSKLISGPQKMEIVYKAKRTTTLIPLSALRSEAENKYYVYVIQENWGGLLSNNTYTVKKQDVTVIETSAKLASIEDEMSQLQLADREDRALKDGQAVMEYVD